MIAKVDHNFNPNNLLTGRYYFGDSDQSFPFAQLAGGLLPGFNTVTPTRVQLVSLSYVKVVNSNQVNEARLGWNRFVEGFFPEDQNFDPSTIGLNTGVTSPFDFGLPKMSVDGFSVIGATNSVPRSACGFQLAFYRQLFVEIRTARCQVRIRVPPDDDRINPGQHVSRQVRALTVCLISWTAFPTAERSRRATRGVTPSKTTTASTFRTASAGLRV